MILKATTNAAYNQDSHPLDKIHVLVVTLIISMFFYVFNINKGIDLLSSTAIPVTLFFLILFISKLGHGLPVKEIMVLLTAVQFLYSPFLAYFFYPPDPIYPMEIEPDEYFGYTVPAVLLFALGLYVFNNFINFTDYSKLIKEYNIRSIGKQLIFLGLAVDLIRPFLPVSIAFFLVLIGYCKFIGAYYIFFSDSKHKKWWIFIAFAPLILSNVSQGMFHELLLWASFSFMIFFIKYNKTFISKVLIVVVVFTGIYYLNIVKKTYRDYTWDSKISYTVTDRIVIFGKSVVEVIFGDQQNLESTKIDGLKSDEHNLSRLNQGVIVTRIMNHTGKRVPFANGETIQDAIEAALVPRFLNPDKVRSGGRDTYTRFTGYYLSSGTSISLSLLGEAYANYGFGGIYFMFFLGLFYSYVLWLIISVAHKSPYLLLWIPFLFLSVIKAEEGFETVLNYLIKASFVLWLLYKVYLKRATYRNIDMGMLDNNFLPTDQIIPHITN